MIKMDENIQMAKPNAGTAAVLSFVFNGLGQLYNGQLAKGLWIIFLSAVSLLLLVIGAILIAFWLLAMNVMPAQLIIGSGFFLAGLTLICIIGIYSIIDAYRVAIKK